MNGRSYTISQGPDWSNLLRSGKALALILTVVVIYALFSCFYQVPANSVGVVQRFGAYLETTEPGLRFKIPFGIDQVTLVGTLRQLKLEFGYGTSGASNYFQYASGAVEQEEEKNMVTGDLNAALVEWVVQFHISDARAFIFNFLEPQRTLRDISEAVMREVVGDRTIDEVLTVGRQEMEIKALERMQELASSLHIGVHIDQIQLRNVNPPAPVQASFDEVNRAQQEKESLINEANGEYNRAIPRARCMAQQRIGEAEGYASKRINEAEGNASRFLAILQQYNKAPDITRRRMYLETMSEVLTAVRNKVIVDEKVQQFLPFLNITGSPRMLAPEAAANQSNSRGK